MKLPRWTGLLLLVAAVGVGAGLAYEGLKPEPAPQVDDVLRDGA